MSWEQPLLPSPRVPLPRGATRPGRGGGDRDAHLLRLRSATIAARTAGHGSPATLPASISSRRRRTSANQAASASSSPSSLVEDLLVDMIETLARRSTHVDGAP